MLETVTVALAFVAAMGLALLLAGVTVATLASVLPAGPAGMVLLVATTLGTVGATIALTRRTFLTVLDAF
jgi:hypothetical protein